MVDRGGVRTPRPVLAIVVAAALIVTTAACGVSAGSADGAACIPAGTSPVAGELDAPMEPRVLGCHVVVLDGNELVAVDAGTLGVTWRLGCPYASWASPIPSQHESIELAQCGGRFVAVDTSVGKALWSQPATADFDRLRVGPAAVAVQSDSDGAVALDLRTGRQLLFQEELRDANVATDEENLYGSTDRFVFAWNLRTGDQLWVEREPSSGLMARDGVLFARTNDHDVRRIDGSTGEVVATSDESRSDELSWSDFVLVNERVAVLVSTRDDPTLSVYDATTAKRLWAVPVSGGTRTVGGADGLLAVTDQRGEVVVYDDLTGEELATIDGITASNPAVRGRDVYVIEVDESTAMTTLRRERV